MKDLTNSISKGKNLEVVLPKYGQEMMDVYYKYAAVRLAMNYYTYNEIITEDTKSKTSFMAFLESFAKNRTHCYI